MELSAAHPHLAHVERTENGGVRFKLSLTKAQVREFVGDEQWFADKLWRVLFPHGKLTEDEQRHEEGKHLQMSQKYEQILRESVEKLSLGPKDIIIVKSPEAMSTFLEMTQQGVGFSPYANPVLLVPGGLERATRADLLDAMHVLDERERQAGKAEGEVSRIITDLSGPMLRKVQ